MTLEQASWIAGIVGAVGTLIGLYFAWEARRLKKEGGGPPGPTIAPDKKEKLIQEIPAAKPEHSLQTALESAKKISLHTDRDSAFVVVARRALEMRNWRFATEVAELMYYNTGKDTLLREIVDTAIKAREWHTADAASDLMFYTTSKDSAKKAITDAASK